MPRSPTRESKHSSSRSKRDKTVDPGSSPEKREKDRSKSEKDRTSKRHDSPAKRESSRRQSSRRDAQETEKSKSRRHRDTDLDAKSKHSERRSKSSRKEEDPSTSYKSLRRDDDESRRRRKDEARRREDDEIRAELERKKKEEKRRKEKEERRKAKLAEKERLEAEKREKEKARRERKKREKEDKLRQEQEKARLAELKAKELQKRIADPEGGRQRQRYSSSESSEDSELGQSGLFSAPSQYDDQSQLQASSDDDPDLDNPISQQTVNKSVAGRSRRTAALSQSSIPGRPDTIDEVGTPAKLSHVTKKAAPKSCSSQSSDSSVSSGSEHSGNDEPSQKPKVNGYGGYSDDESDSREKKESRSKSRRSSESSRGGDEAKPGSVVKKSSESADAQKELRWGFKIDEAYLLAVNFYKANLGKTFTPQYSQKVQLHALIKQIRYGPYESLKKRDLPPDPGWFDIFGHDQLECWKKMGRVDKSEAKLEFIDELGYLAKSSFAPFMSAHQKHAEEEARKRREEEERRRREEQARVQREILAREERKRMQILEAQQMEDERQRREEEKKAMDKKRSIMGVLNAQTEVQFRQYVTQQHPGDLAAQNKLMVHLQEQHYKQYLTQLESQGLRLEDVHQTGNINARITTQTNGSHPQLQPSKPPSTAPDNRRPKRNLSQNPCSDNIEQVSHWTRPPHVLREFKDQIKQDRDSVITVSRGEVVTIRVPTHEEGNYLFWEFATDNYDLGFGVFFEWAQPTEDEMMMQQGSHHGSHIDSQDPDDFGYHSQPPQRNFDMPKRIDEVYPIFRRDSQIEVQCGSHQYPGHGVYLLRFDNSFSLWRSKTLYYRVYYTR